MKKYIVLLLITIIFTSTNNLLAHCEIPCGIYADKMRIEMMQEHITTIEKSMYQINELQKSDNINYNQLVRWINNKDDHASNLQQIISQYFLTQRIKLVDNSNNDEIDKYQKELSLLHQILVYSMKTKQTTDLKHCDKLRELVDDFYNIYFTEDDTIHLDTH